MINRQGVKGLEADISKGLSQKIAAAFPKKLPAGYGWADQRTTG